jgi:thymidine kinase
MFIEPRLSGKSRKGWIEVVCGSMFSGKTEELIRRIKRAMIANQSVELFKPVVDQRYSIEEIVSHDARTIPSTPVDSPQNMLLYANNIEVIGIDEAQFFNHELVEVAQILAARGSRVIIAGLDMDYLGKPFGPIPDLMAVAEYVTKVHAICVQCGDLASHSYRKSSSKNKVLLGEKNFYEPRCRSCFDKGMIDQSA